MACNGPQTKEINALKETCIHIHDEVMPRMGEISELRTSLREWKRTVDGDTTDSLYTLGETIWTHVILLDSADESMMEWMANYEPSYEEAHPADSAIVYYTAQKAEIERVKTLMEKSINDAKNLLDYHH